MKPYMIILALALGLVAMSCSQAPSDTAVSTGAKYHCAMHPGIVSDQPGNCPICGMKLVPMGDAKQAAAMPAKKTMYRSTMNVNEVSDHPGKDSMGMEMVPFEVTAGGEKTPAGLAAVSITPEARERMGLTLGTIEKRSLSREVRTSARIVADETKLFHVTLKVEGWVEHLHDITVGKLIQKGEPLLKIYSPDLLAGEQEYLVALKLQEQLAKSDDPESVRRGDSLLAAARERLRLWDISEEQITELEKSRAVEKTVTLRAPATGVVMARNVAAGHKLMQGEPLLEMADLSTVWAEADIYESDLPFVKVGMPVELGLPYWTDKTFKGNIIFISATLDPEIRTLKARLAIANPDYLLKPEMFATARLSYELGNKLAIPETAVMQTGEHTYAFRDAGDGRLVPTEIEIGPRSGEFYELRSGLKEGDKVVTSANFLIDSESAMKGALEAVASASGERKAK